MTTMTAAPLTESQQALIDARLDTIDRMLLGRVPRSDRVAIVRVVESQIQELLAERDPPATSRDDVLEVLRRLDPPEAYLPDETETGEFPRSPRFVPPAITGTAKPKGGHHGRLGGILGLCSLGVIFLFPVSYLMAMALSSEIVLFLGLGAAVLLGFATSIAGLTLSIRGRREGALPVLGIISAAFTLSLCFLGLLFTAYVLVLNM